MKKILTIAIAFLFVSTFINAQKRATNYTLTLKAGNYVPASNINEIKNQAVLSLPVYRGNFYAIIQFNASNAGFIVAGIIARKALCGM